MQFPLEALKNFFRKPSTEKYPVERRELPEGFRGRPVWIMEKCVGCGLCARVCPVKAIQITGKGKDAGITYFLNRCIFCGQCAESCNLKAVEITREFEFADYDKLKMIHLYDKKQSIIRE